jgi:hypothetical protein
VRRVAGALVLVVAVATAASAQSSAPATPSSPTNTTRGTGGPRVDAVVPIPPTEHERLHFFGRRDHHRVPGTVTIDKPPYVCDVDGERFTDRDAFVAHLRSRHRIASARIPDTLVVQDGQVHFLGK